MARQARDVLVVEDDDETATFYCSWLFDEWNATVAATVEEALRAIESGPDVVVLDRRLPDGSGEEVLAALRATGNDCPVVMVTGMEPDFDIVDLSFDDYLVKPFGRESFRACMTRLSDRVSYDTELRELYALVSKKAVLEDRKSDAELSDSHEYTELRQRVERQRDRADELLPSDFEGYAGLFRGLFADVGPAEP